MRLVDTREEEGEGEADRAGAVVGIRMLVGILVAGGQGDTGGRLEDRDVAEEERHWPPNQEVAGSAFAMDTVAAEDTVPPGDVLAEEDTEDKVVLGLVVNIRLVVGTRLVVDNFQILQEEKHCCC